MGRYRWAPTTPPWNKCWVNTHLNTTHKPPPDGRQPLFHEGVFADMRLVTVKATFLVCCRPCGRVSRQNQLAKVSPSFTTTVRKSTHFLNFTAVSILSDECVSDIFSSLLVRIYDTKSTDFHNKRVSNPECPKFGYNTIVTVLNIDMNFAWNSFGEVIGNYWWHIETIATFHYNWSSITLVPFQMLELFSNIHNCYLTKRFIINLFPLFDLM